jgi:mono/diheme cytochrome c family protein
MRPAHSALLGSALVLPALVACTAMFASGCAHAPGYPPRAMARPDEVTDFATLYSQKCVACHGRNGQNGPAIDLGNPEYQALADDDVLNSWISGGIPGTEMPAFAQSAGGMLSNGQIEALIAGMRKQWAKPNAFGGAVPPPYEQPDTGDARRGADAYRARCAGCHAPSPQQITSRTYLALVADQQLRSIVIAGRPDIGHPDWRHDGPEGKPATPLSAEEIDNIVAYLGSLRTPAAATAPEAIKPPQPIQPRR